jgi:hypothetical protein
VTRPGQPPDLLADMNLTKPEGPPWVSSHARSRGLMRMSRAAHETVRTWRRVSVTLHCLAAIAPSSCGGSWEMAVKSTAKPSPRPGSFGEAVR